ncbi:sigma-54 dependent transcriptional regulator [Aeoliella sp. ICT_H6.2]|uniref:Sigma-54 dependent transcriptional regulator n=1 Tax=Aeoliella straminimaris TaxID=2954799 RepID=A0A9X2FAK6_9BACT|nr:sigma-54 dependent transcriptional regulator [Aeoliella straminimaris]MCO6045440.1 sigma-54 dependent transcriptional regulator [Aeoliella straminimaris]
MADHKLDLLLVDDDAELRDAMQAYFSSLGHRVAAADCGESALGTLASHSFTVAVVDMVMPGMSGLDLLARMKEETPETEVILLTGQGTIERAVEAMKLGAYDFLTKPVRMKQLETVVGKAGESAKIRKENTQLRALVDRGTPKHKMIGNSPAMQEVFRLVERAGPSEKPILIQGESGTGKELVARALHDASCRSDKPMVVINCAALPEPLLESELFGHEKGAFTGAAASKPGLFEVADGGTLFIDEIGELAPALQPKLLRVLEDGSMRRVGSLKERRVDVRMIAATNRDLNAEVEARRFREDLFYRINIMTIMLPPLRARTTDDVLLLADHFAGGGWEFDSECREAIAHYSWPGNVRQLINAIERAKILSDDEVLRKENLPPEVLGNVNTTGAAIVAPEIDLAALTRARVVQALQHEGGNKLRAAKSLGVSRRSLYRLIEKYHIDPSEVS